VLSARVVVVVGDHLRCSKGTREDVAVASISGGIHTRSWFISTEFDYDNAFAESYCYLICVLAKTKHQARSRV
jgi:hypothetical protein